MVHFEILREYLRLEFIDMDGQIKFEFDADRIADDWVLLCILHGNDYIPKMPNFDFELGILSVLYDAYREYLGQASGMYIPFDCSYHMLFAIELKTEMLEIDYWNFY